MDTGQLDRFIRQHWEASALPALQSFIRIPAKSPHFDAQWQENGYLDQAVREAADWCEDQGLDDATVEIVRLPGRTPLLLVDIPGERDGAILFYGHLDKQPEVTGWSEGLGPWEPVVRDGRLYGRGSADDGYALYASLTAVRAVREQGLPHARCILLIETCEESGSYDLPAYLEHLAERIGQPDLVVCLDSGCGNYEQLWCTTSLRGLAAGTLRVEILREGVHSGDAGGVVPSSFRIARQLLDRLEDPATGAIRPAAFNAEIPAHRREQAQTAAAVLGNTLATRFPFADGAGPAEADPAELVLNRSWRPTLEVTGAEGLPPLSEAGNVLRAGTALQVSLRLPPTVDGNAATDVLKELLEADPPCGARVRFDSVQAATGWHAPELPEWLADSLETGSRAAYGKPVVHMGEGGSIPLMALLSRAFPDARFIITGVLGPQSNAHGPNEFLHLGMVERLTTCVARVVADHGHQA